MAQILFNGEWQSEEQATVSILSESVQYGLGLFETLRTYNKKSLPFLDRHINRLTRSAHQMGLELNYQPAEIEAMVHEVVQAQHADTLRIKLLLIPEGLAIYATELVPDPVLSNGVSLMSQIHQRANPEHKGTAYADCYRAWRKAQENGYYDTLFISESGQVLEASRANIFYLKDDIIYTPKEGMLGGIMREVVLELADQTEQGECTLQDLIQSDGVFITNSIIGITPVSKIDNRTLADVKASNVYQNLIERLLTETDKTN